MRICLETLSYAALVQAFCLALALAPAPAFGGSGKVYMSSQYGDSLYVADLSVMDTWGKVKVGNGPDRLVASADGRYAFVSAPDEDRVVVIDVSADMVEHSIEAGKRPRVMALTPDGKRLLVCSDSMTVSVVDTALFKEVGKLNIAGSASDIKVSPDGREAYVTEGGRIEVIDIAKMAVSRWVDFPAEGALMEISHSGDRLYVYGQEDKQVHVLDAASLKQTGAIKAGWGLKMSPDGKYLWFNGPGEMMISVYSTMENKVVATLPRDSDRSSCYFGFSPDGKQVILGPAGKENNKVYVYDAESFKKTGELTAPPVLGDILYLAN